MPKSRNKKGHKQKVLKRVKNREDFYRSYQNMIKKSNATRERLTEAYKNDTGQLNLLPESTISENSTKTITQ
jgi:DNA-binding protein H-NS